MEQLQAVTLARSVVASKRTLPQWQPPASVFVSLIVGTSSTSPGTGSCSGPQRRAGRRRGSRRGEGVDDEPGRVGDPAGPGTEEARARAPHHRVARSDLPPRGAPDD